MPERFWITTLGCPKNEVDSEKLVGRLSAGGYEPAEDPSEADLVVVNTCAFIDAAREESVEAILELDGLRKSGARLVVTGCLAERSGDELADAIGGIDLVAGFGVPVELRTPRRVVHVDPLAPDADGLTTSFDLLELPRPRALSPWAYVKVAEGCDRRCGYCAIPSFRGAQRSRPLESILDEIAVLEVREVVLVAQDLASYGRDHSDPTTWNKSDGIGIVELVEAAARRVERLRLLYLYPSSIDERLIEAVANTGLPYFDLSLQHASGRLLREMRRWGSAERFLELIGRIRRLEPKAVFRSSFIVGYPGETEEDHDEMLEFLDQAKLDWAGFFTFSREAGTLAAGLGEQVPAPLALERLGECAQVQEAITTERRQGLVGTTCDVLVDRPGQARSFREAPEIDGIINVPATLPTGWLGSVSLVGASGPDLEAVPALELVGG
ncbi:MAG: 30S ribosomal protein S12 methylthiotransferase RimO [Acidimicrobiales bacterium]|jgi:ribosomal protein S12 methylthiotransferase